MNLKNALKLITSGKGFGYTTTQRVLVRDRYLLACTIMRYRKEAVEEFRDADSYCKYCTEREGINDS